MKVIKTSILLALILVLILFSGCRTANITTTALPKMDYDWQKDKNPKNKSIGYEIYTRKVKGSSYKVFKINGNIQATPKEAIEALRFRIENWNQFYSEEDAYFEILEDNPHDLLVYSIFKLPFPFKDRSMCERFKISIDEVSKMRRISWYQEWEKAPVEKGILRMPKARGSWTFVTIDSTTCNATYEIYSEPGGMLPGWLYNSTVKKGLPKELKDIEEIVAELRNSSFTD